jgi:ABC-type bacteriocin/lantibiotic exporter with double-glycine peptidase domain
VIFSSSSFITGRRPAPGKALAAALFLVLLACAGTSVVRGPAHLPVHLIEGVPFYAQEAHQCGPASLAGVLNYWGVDVSPEEVAGRIYSASARGTLGIDMAFYARDRGLHASQYAGGLGDLRASIDAGRPLIVMVDYGFWVYQANHFMVVVGYTDEGLIVNSGKEREKFLPLDKFLKSWERAGYWTLSVARG